MKLVLSPGLSSEETLDKLLAEVRQVDFITGRDAPWLLRADKVKFEAQSQTAQSIPDNTTTGLIFDTVISDPAGQLDSAGSQIVIAETGVYTITAGVRFASNTTGLRRIQIRSRDRGALADSEASAVGGVRRCNVCRTAINLQKRDVIIINVFQNSGGALNTSPSPGDEFVFVSMSREA
jgi:hypothetical protein